MDTTKNFILIIAVLVAGILLGNVFTGMVIKREDIFDGSGGGGYTTVPTTTPYCVDSDGGQDIYEKGYVINSTGLQSWDYCLPNGTLRPVGEWYCTKLGSISTAFIECPSGYLCNDGACRLA